MCEFCVWYPCSLATSVTTLTQMLFVGTKLFSSPYICSLPGFRSSYFSLSTVLFRSFPLEPLSVHMTPMYTDLFGSIHPALISQSSSLVPHQMCVPYCWLVSSNSTVPQLCRHVYRIKGKPSNSVTIWVLWCSLFQMCR